MSYCINPSCPHRENSDLQKVCAACGMRLLIRGRYRLIRPIQELSRSKHLEVFEAEDLLSGLKIIKIPKTDYEELVNIFCREAQVLRHVNYSDVGWVEGRNPDRIRVLGFAIVLPNLQLLQPS
jgi:hypothetical protein